MTRILLPLLLALLLAACAPSATSGVANADRPDEPLALKMDPPWSGCVYIPALYDIDCDYRDIDLGGDAPATMVPPPDDDITAPPRPPNEPPAEPEEPEEPGDEPRDEPDAPEEPEEDPNEGDEPPPADDCKPGWGHGDENHCHDGPPGRM